MLLRFFLDYHGVQEPADSVILLLMGFEQSVLQIFRVEIWGIFFPSKHLSNTMYLVHAAANYRVYRIYVFKIYTED